MENRLEFTEEMLCAVARSPGMALDELLLKGKFNLELVRGCEVIDKREAFNSVCTGGKNSLLDVTFRNQTQLATWYFMLIDNASFSALAPTTDVMSSHAGWIESVAYSDATRQAWSPGAASGASITNGTVATFNINGSATLYGAAITSGSAKSGTSGILWSEAAFSGGTVGVVNGDQLRLTYTLSC